MSQKTFSAKIEIKKPPDDVFSYTTDLDNIPLWTDAETIKDISSEETQVGTSFVESYKYRAKLVDVKSTVIQYFPNTFWSYHSKAAAYSYSIKHSFKKNDSSTLITTECVLEFGGLFAFSLFFHLISERLGKRQLQKNLEKLKGIMEQSKELEPPADEGA